MYYGLHFLSYILLEFMYDERKPFSLTYALKPFSYLRNHDVFMVKYCEFHDRYSVEIKFFNSCNSKGWDFPARTSFRRTHEILCAMNLKDKFSFVVCYWNVETDVKRPFERNYHRFCLDIVYDDFIMVKFGSMMKREVHIVI